MSRQTARIAWWIATHTAPGLMALGWLTGVLLFALVAPFVL
jgi:hypothetical protein